TITLEGGPKINGAVISSPDVEASNGVIHVIDSVILPPEG
ncbi:MAG: fasciclin domain-containing protein, partial [Paracoccaceae bacterium]|nr:fasciclin domain-containing protein [Paracoccaceae bacterium]